MNQDLDLSKRQLLAGAPLAMLATASAGPPERTNSAGPDDLVLTMGAHRIAIDTTVSGQLIFERDARLEIVAGVTLTLRGDLVAPTRRLFWGAGRIDLTHSRVLAARPEWWGAVADDAAVDCEPALTACLASHIAILLGCGDYYIANTWKIDRSNRRVWGIGRTKNARGTRLVLTRGGVGTVVLVGTEQAPPTINDYVSGVDLRWIELGRTQSPQPPGDDPATGLSIRHVLDCTFETLRANEHAVGYSIRGAVRSYLRDCRAFRSIAIDAKGRDSFVGFDMDGRHPPIPTGANASLYMLDCNAATGDRPRLALSVGARLTGAMSDTFLTRFETTEMGTGIAIEGDGDGDGDATGDRNEFVQVDVHIDTPVLDQCGIAGIAVSGLIATAMMEIRSPYVALAPGGGAAIRIARGGGSVLVCGGQLIGSFSDGAIGVALDHVSGVALAGTALLGFARPIDANGARGFELVCRVIAAVPGAAAAITLTGCHQGYVRPRLSGAARGYSTAVAVDVSSGALSIEATGVDPAALARGAAMVTIGGRAAPRTGTVVTIASGGDGAAL